MAFSFNKNNDIDIAGIFKNDIDTKECLRVLRDEGPDTQFPTDCFRNIKLKKGFTFQPKICSNSSSVQRENLFIYGPSGVGKSTLCSSIIKQYKKDFPSNKILLISGKNEDFVLDSIKKLKRVSIDDSIIEQPISLEEISNSLVVFDDYECLEKKYQNAINQLRDTILQLGRSYFVSCIIISHIPLQGQRSKVILIESCKLIFFRDTNRMQNNRVLSVYCGLTKEQIDELYRIRTRYYLIHRFSPRYILTEKEALILGNE